MRLRIVAALIGILALFGCSVHVESTPAQPTHSARYMSSNQVFIHTVRSEPGLNAKLSHDNALVIRSGHAACTLMEHRQYMTLINTLRFQANLTPKQVGEFAGAAGYVYCPAALHGFEHWLKTQRPVVE